ncbi:hypothetical protein J7E99_02705 [Streptomyces sp. ISL-44]|uniref:hypothetical protein n=1 Tax=Streptomyces sp. ISL-44 TaxID=2819184 RepID=UPI001BE86CBF|nr:hypothetical protein [Streptomyces sp. ISL-44]MBT2539647.1 hypothetical protein [Streptomyces sp. ISL-44]
MRMLALAFPLALADEYFGFRNHKGQRIVPLDQAHVFAAARIDLWDRWPQVPRRVRELVGAYWHVRPGDVAGRSAFYGLARSYASSPEGLYRLPDDVEPREVTYLVVAHAQRPLRLAQALLGEAEELYYGNRGPQPVATAGKWAFGSRDLSVVTVPAGEGEAGVAPLRLRTAPWRREVALSRRQVLRLARRQAATNDRNGWKPGLMARFFDRLLGSDDRRVARLRLPVGKVTVLNAPTGVGKSVLLNAAAPLLVRQGKGPVTVVVGQIHESLSNTERMREADEELSQHAAAERLRQDDDLVRQTAADLAAANPSLKIVPLVSGYRLVEQAERALAQGRDRRFEELAYGCDLSAWPIDGPPVRRSAEPCLSLKPIVAPGQEEPSPGHACPRLGICGKYALIRAAMDADIIVTNHHNLLRGSLPVPMETDKGVLRRMSVLEFVLRLCAVLLIDEIDHLQSSWCDLGSDTFTLSSRAWGGSSLLAEVDRQREDLDAASDRRLVNALFKARGLGDQFLNYVLDDELWLETVGGDDDRPSSDWHVPGLWDRWLLDKLLHVDITKPIGRDVHEEFRAIFPDRDKKASPPPRYAQLAELLAKAVSRDASHDALPRVKTQIDKELGRLKISSGQRREITNALLVRSWLGCLHKSLVHLKAALAGLGAGEQLTAGRELARALGTFSHNPALPYGPLGYQLFGFKVEKNQRGGGRLSVQTLGGDPHTSTVQLGGTIALATAGVERSVLALSATAFFPRAAKEHLHTQPAYVMTDAAPGAVTARPGNVSDTDCTWNPIGIGGQEESSKPARLLELGAQLWRDRLSEHLRDLEIHEPDRARAMVVTNSYRQSMLLATGIAAAIPDPSWIAVVIPRTGPPAGLSPPPGVLTITVDQLEDLPYTHPHVKVVCAPLRLVARALNILIPGTDRSALSSVWVATRPAADLHTPEAMYASIGAAGIAAACPGPDPARMLAVQTRAAHNRLNWLLCSSPMFSRLPRFLKTELLAGILVDMIQLAGRARRGGTPVQLYLVDNAFFATCRGTDYPSLLRAYYDELTEAEQYALRRAYGSTLTAWLDLAHAADRPHLIRVPLPRTTATEYESS